MDKNSIFIKQEIMETKIKKYLNTENWFDYSKFYDMIATKNYKTLVEVGVWKGHSICYLANKLKNKDVDLYAVDLWDETYKYDNKPDIKVQKPHLYDIFKENIKNANLTNKIKDIKSISWEAASNFEDDSVDFVFIDADHEYDSVIKDIDSWLPKIKKDGIIAGHDYFNPCVVLNKLWMKNLGVKLKLIVIVGT